MKKISASIVLITISMICGLSSPIASADGNFARSYSGLKFAQDMIKTSDGGYVAVGFNSSFVPFNDLWLVKFDSAFNLVWKRFYSEFGTFEWRGVAETSSGELVVVSMVASTGTAGDIEYLRVDANGIPIQHLSFGGSFSVTNTAQAVIATADGGVLIAGNRVGGVSDDAIILKIDALGAVQWQNRHGISAGVTDGLKDIVATSDGGAIFVGTTFSAGAGSADAWAVKLDSAGNVIWQKTYGGSRVDVAQNIIQDGNQYVIAGHSNSFSPSTDFWVFKIDENGDTVGPQKIYGNATFEAPFGLSRTTDGGYVISGWSLISSPYSGGRILRLNGDLTLKWQKETQLGITDRILAPALDTGDGHIVAMGFNSISFFVKLEDSDGSLSSDCNITDINSTVADTFVTAASTFTSTAPAGLLMGSLPLTYADAAVLETTLCPLVQDADGDGISDNQDNCPSVPNADHLDSDGDDIGDACDTCPFDAANDQDGDGVCGDVDNCPLYANPDQADADDDGSGDLCDTTIDTDGDSVLDEDDLCPDSVPDNIALNPNQYAQNDFSNPALECGSGASSVYNSSNTFGCTCKQIADILGLGAGHIKKGCSAGIMQQFTGIAHVDDQKNKVCQ